MDSSLLPPSSPLDYVSIAAIQPLVYCLILNAVWASILVLMFFFMFFLSTSQIRRTALFIMNVVAVVSGMLAGFLHVKSMTMAILHPNTPSSRDIQIIPPVISLILPIYIDCILAARLYIVYPRSLTSPLHLAIIFIPVVALKVLRTANTTYLLIRFSLHLEHDPSLMDAFGAVLSETPCMQIEWISGIVDNCWASVWFLWRLRHDVMRRGPSSDIGLTAGTTARSVSGQLQKLFCLGLSSFVFPCVLNILSVALYYKRSIFVDSYNFVSSTNTNFQIIGVLLATIWVSKERSFRDSDSYEPGTSLPFHATVDPSRTWGSENLPPGPPRVEAQPMANVDGAVIVQLDPLPPAPGGYIRPKENVV
ncbi:hypothetical protein DL96DRAFT_372265 [Flagelloscypha sp. PMI_526]|nr:hypothetical protein DL96DRAFT_372265 [Flagelloscypha sp. PMI_526]